MLLGLNGGREAQALARLSDERIVRSAMDALRGMYRARMYRPYQGS